MKKFATAGAIVVSVLVAAFMINFSINVGEYHAERNEEKNFLEWCEFMDHYREDEPYRMVDDILEAVGYYDIVEG